MNKTKKITVLEKLLSDGVFADEAEARAWVMTGRVLVNDVRVMSVHEKMRADDTLRVKELYKREFVGKGAFKLAEALDAFSVSVEGRVCLDCGASTGGFTDRLLSRGAAHVYAVDAGHGMLAGKLQNDPRVSNMERTNLADEKLKTLSPRPSLVTLDLSYLSLVTAYPLVCDILEEGGEAILLVKPIFETEDAAIRRSGEINDASALTDVFSRLFAFFGAAGAGIFGVIASPVRGNTGVVEFFLHVRPGVEGLCREELDRRAKDAIDAALSLPRFSKEQI